MFSGLKPIVIAIASFGLVIPCTGGIAKEFSRVSEQERTVERGSQIVVRNEFGNISITGSDRNTLEAVATDPIRSQAFPVTISEGSGGIKRVFTVSPLESARSPKQKINLEVKVPRDVVLERIYVRSGNINISDLNTGVSLRTDDGNITVNRVGSPGGGLIDLTTGSGNVDVANVDADVRVVSISSGISVQCVKGDVAARVSSGQIAVSDITGDVELNNSSGNLYFTGAINSESRYRLKTLSGDVYMDIPGTVGFTAVLSAYSGRIETEFQFPNASQLPPSRSNRRIIGKHGDGRARIDLDSFSGGVFLRKVDASSGPNCQE